MNEVAAIRPIDKGQLRDVSGLTLPDDGDVALIIDIPDLLAPMGDGSGRSPQLEAPLTPIAEPAAEPEHSLVVDDSIRVREVERHLF